MNNGTTKAAKQARLSRLNREYSAAIREIEQKGDTRFATAKEMREEVCRLYIGSIRSLERALGIM